MSDALTCSPPKLTRLASKVISHLGSCVLVLVMMFFDLVISDCAGAVTLIVYHTVFTRFISF